MNSFVYIISFFLIGSRNMKDDAMKRELVKGDIVAYGFVCSLLEHGGKKMVLLQNTITDALFIQPEKKKHIQDVFYDAQRVYHGMCHLARYFKVRRARKFDVQSDLCLNPLSELSPHIIYHLYDDDNRTLYSFRMSDLMTIVNTALLHSPDFFADPQTIRNPYTNIEFTRAQLYSLYFAVKRSSYVTPLLFHQYFKVDFNILEFCKSNECYIREAAIESFVRNASTNQKYLQILKMFVDYRRQLEGIVIHDDFPKKKFVAHFSKHLNDYLLECYSLNPAIRHFSKRKLKGELLRFKTLNPKYGRKIATVTYKTYTAESAKQRDAITQTPFVFGSTSPTEVKRTVVYSFVDEVITKAPKPRVRSIQKRRQPRSRRASIVRNRTLTDMNTSTSTSALLDEAFTSLRMGNDTPHTPHTPHTPNTHINAIIDENGDEIEDEATDYQSDNSIDIDVIIDMINSDESTIDSESDVNYNEIEDYDDIEDDDDVENDDVTSDT